MNLRDDPVRRRQVKARWHRWLRERYIDNLIAITYEPHAMWYALKGEPCPPRTRYCIDSWTVKT